MFSVLRPLFLFLLLVPVLARPSVAQSTVEGRWDGAIHIMGQELAVQVTFTPAPAGLKAAISIPAQGATNIALTNVRVDGESVHFELPAGPGLALFDGSVKGDSISGTFTQGEAKGSFDLKRSKAAPPSPEPPPPYRQEEVTIANGTIKLAGTLTLPPTPGRHPAVMLITGSGAQDRDEDIFGFKVFRVIADHLTRQGMAVLRCDDRGVGGSTGSVSESTSDDFAGDVMAAIAYLKSRPDIDAKRIGLIGHSEGAIVAPMVATRSAEVAFIVLLSGPSLTGEQIMLLQGERMLKLRGANAEILALQARTQRLLFDVSRGKTTVEDASSQLMQEAGKQAASLPEAQRAKVLEMARMQVGEQIKSVQSRWFRYFLDYDPALALARVKCPVLALFGELDLQVPVDVNRPGMEKAFAGNRDATINVLPKANHLYQLAKVGDPAEYATLEKSFVPELLPMLSTWIRQHAGMGSN